VTAHSVYRALVRNHAKLAYDDVGAWLDGEAAPAKVAGNKVLTFTQNRLAGVRLSEWHSGYRAFRVSLLATVPD